MEIDVTPSIPFVLNYVSNQQRTFQTLINTFPLLSVNLVSDLGSKVRQAQAQDHFSVVMLLNCDTIPDRKKTTQYLSFWVSDLKRNYQLDVVTSFLHEDEHFKNPFIVKLLPSPPRSRPSVQRRCSNLTVRSEQTTYSNLLKYFTFLCSWLTND